MKSLLGNKRGSSEVEEDVLITFFISDLFKKLVEVKAVGSCDGTP